MHGRIFEIREERLPREEWMKASDFYEEDTRGWCDYLHDSEDRKDDLDWLKSGLPSSIFKLDGDKIEIISDGKEFVEEWIAELKEEVNKLTYDTFTQGVAATKVKTKLNSMIKSGFMFYTDYACYPHNPTSFIRDCITAHQGKTFYVCGIIDYHY